MLVLAECAGAAIRAPALAKARSTTRAGRRVSSPHNLNSTRRPPSPPTPRQSTMVSFAWSSTPPHVAANGQDLGGDVSGSDRERDPGAFRGFARASPERRPLQNRRRAGRAGSPTTARRPLPGHRQRARAAAEDFARQDRSQPWVRDELDEQLAGPTTATTAATAHPSPQGSARHGGCSDALCDSGASGSSASTKTTACTRSGRRSAATRRPLGRPTTTNSTPLGSAVPAAVAPAAVTAVSVSLAPTRRSARRRSLAGRQRHLAPGRLQDLRASAPRRRPEQRRVDEQDRCGVGHAAVSAASEDQITTTVVRKLRRGRPTAPATGRRWRTDRPRCMPGPAGRRR